MWQLAEDTLSQADLDALADWLRGGPRLTQGELVAEFERQWSRWLGARESVVVSSGTAANFALMAALTLRHEGSRPLRVGVSAVTWPTNVTPSLFLGHDVTVFDINPATLGMDSDQLGSAMRRGEIDVVFVTHLLGFDALDDEVLSLAQECGVIVVEDCCEAHGARHGLRKVGTLGLASSFSFYFGHHMSTIEGGVVSTDDLDLAELIRLVRAHGLARETRSFEALALAHPSIDPRFLFIEPGLNFRSTDLNAFLGLRQLRVLDERIQCRNRNLRRFLDGLPDSLWKDYRTEGVSSFALPLVMERPGRLDKLRRVLDDAGVESRPIVAGNLLRQPFIRRSRVRGASGGTPVADHVHANGLYVGNGHHVTEQEIDRLLEWLGELELRV